MLRCCHASSGDRLLRSACPHKTLRPSGSTCRTSLSQLHRGSHDNSIIARAPIYNTVFASEYRSCSPNCRQQISVSVSFFLLDLFFFFRLVEITVLGGRTRFTEANDGSARKNIRTSSDKNHGAVIMLVRQCNNTLPGVSPTFLSLARTTCRLFDLAISTATTPQQATTCSRAGFIARV